MSIQRVVLVVQNFECYIGVLDPGVNIGVEVNERWVYLLSVFAVGVSCIYSSDSYCSSRYCLSQLNLAYFA